MQLLKDAGGKQSYSRIVGLVIIGANLIASLKVVWSGGGQIPDIPLNWGMLASALYGLNVWKHRDKA